MSNFIITYLGGNQPPSPKEGQKHFAKYQEWLTSLGDSAVSPMNPLKNTNTVNPDRTVTVESKTTMSGYTIIEAAKSCPFLDINGSLEVSELLEMKG